MELFGVFFFFIFMIVAFGGFVALFGGIIFYSFYKRGQNREAWKKISQSLGLKMPNAGNFEMIGNYNGCNVRLAIGSRSSGSGENRSVEYFTYCETAFPHSLRLLLNISSPKGFLSRLLSSNEIAIGNEFFDKNFHAKCYDPNVLRTLLLSDFPSMNTQNLLGDLVLAHRIIEIIEINDNKIYIEESGEIADFGRIKQMLDITTSLAKRFRAGREKLPLTRWERQLLQTWESVARQYDLLLDSKNLQLRGNYKNLPIFVSTKTQAGNWMTEIKVNFNRNLLAGLSITRDSTIQKVLAFVGAQDIKANHKAFDDAFVVKARNPLFARHILMPDLCQHLVGLNPHISNISITDEDITITLNWTLGDENTLKSYLQATTLAAQMILR